MALSSAAWSSRDEQSYDGVSRTSVYDRLWALHPQDTCVAAAASGRSDEALTSMEAYWQHRSRCAHADATASAANESLSDTPREAEAAEPFPACFYARMIRPRASVPSPSLSPDACLARPTHIDEDHLANRLADQIRHSTREREAQRRAAARAAESGPLYNGARIAPYADAQLEAKLAALHHETTSLLLHVRHENRQSCELRERLTHSKLLLERTHTLKRREASV